MKITRESLGLELTALCVPKNAVLMVHASLRKLGPVEGGAEAVLDVLLEAVGPGGTLLMLLCASDAEPFDPLTTPADEEVGVLAEVFRRRAGTLVNDHAAARFGAYGPRANELLEPTPLHDYYGSGSVLERFAGAGGLVLRLGANVDTVTLTHWAEYRANLARKRRVRSRYVRADIGEQWIESLDDSGGVAEWSEGDYFSQILLDYLAAGHARTGRVGNCAAELFSAEHYAEFAVRWMEARL
ncbi:MAG: AAC(3) family N-acetyltransferase [Meiothermus sp.]|nr:AAC(3) family N-acetyltransferase [Meiothermus sp.]